ncbi:hypothetical protein FXF02_14045 [Vibrio cholerae]|nr:hypothetical protein FXF02_14045 [Vibrio cholerae]
MQLLCLSFVVMRCQPLRRALCANQIGDICEQIKINIRIYFSCPYRLHFKFGYNPRRAIVLPCHTYR